MESDLRLLLVEDSPEDERLLLRSLRSAGLTFAVTRVQTRAELTVALADPWDLVITDYVLPDVTGDQVLESVLGRWHHTPVIVLSGRVGEDLAVEMMRRGASDYILKDNLARVPFAVDRILQEGRVRQARARAEAQVVRLGRMYRLLSETNQAIVRISEPLVLLQEVCRLACRLGPFDVTRVTQGGTAGVHTVAVAGDGPEPVLTGEPTVLDGGRAWVSGDLSSALVPLRSNGAVWGCLGFHARSAGTFTAEETTLLQDLADDVGFGLQSRQRDLQRRETEQFLTDMANLVPGVFYKLRKGPRGDFRFEYVSPGIDLLLPLSPALVQADAAVVMGAVHPSDRRRLTLSGLRSEANLTVFSLQFRLLRPNGSVVWVLATAFPQMRDDGAAVWTGLAIDVTPQNKLQEALRREQDLLAVILNNIGDGVVAVDEQGRLALVNQTARKLLEADNPPDLPWDSRERFTPWFRRRADGTELHLEAHVTELAAPGQASRGLVMLLRDMTERDRIEDRLHQSEKLESIGLLAGGIAHDFNNLLTGVFGFIQLARMNADEADKVVSYLDHALGPFQRARTLTQQLLTFAKGGEPAKVPLALGTLLESMVPFTLAGTAVRWSPEFRPDCWHIVANEAQVHQVFENLFLNAKQALGDAGGQLTVRLRNVGSPGPEDRGLEAGDYVEAVVEDDGPGIEAEVLPKVFDPFFTTKASGTGLGLSICFSVLKKHGGTIEVESSPGCGSRFRMFWPARPSPGPASGG